MNTNETIYKVSLEFETTGMNPYATQMTPLITGIFHDTKYLPELMSLIERHMLKPQHYSE